jgi:hypothetical protein
MALTLTRTQCLGHNWGTQSLGDLSLKGDSEVWLWVLRGFDPVVTALKVIGTPSGQRGLLTEKRRMLLSRNKIKIWSWVLKVCRTPGRTGRWPSTQDSTAAPGEAPAELVHDERVTRTLGLPSGTKQNCPVAPTIPTGGFSFFLSARPLHEHSGTTPQI